MTSDASASLYSRGKQWEILKAFQRACSAESQILTQRPDLIWPQLYNRLQWDGDAVTRKLAPELTRRAEHATQPWLHLRTQLPESEGLIRTMRGHSHQVDDCTFSPDGNWLLSGSLDGLIRWDTLTGQILSRIAEHAIPGSVDVCKLQPHGSLVAAVGSLSRVDLYDVETGKRHARPLEQVDGVCEFSPDGHLLACATKQNTIEIWQVVTPLGEEPPRHLMTLAGHSARLTACQFSPDGGSLVSADTSGVLILWNLHSGQPYAQRQGHDESGPVQAAFRPDGGILVTAGGSGEVGFWNAHTLEPRTAPHSMHLDRITSLALSHDGDYVITGSHDGGLIMWDVALGQARALLRGHTGHISKCAISPDNARIASVSWDRTLRLWDADNGRESAIFRGHEAHIWSCAFSPDGTMVATASGDYTIRLWDAYAESQKEQPAAHRGQVNVCAYSPRGDLIASGGADGVVYLWDAGAGKKIGSLNSHGGGITSFAIAPDGQHIATGSEAGHLEQWDLTTHQMQSVFKPGHTKRVTGTLFTPDGTQLITSGWDGSVKVWDVVSGGVTQEWSTTTVHLCVMSSDGTRIIAGTDGDLVQWNLASGEAGPVMRGHRGEVYACVVSPGGAWAASTNGDQTLRVWDTQTGEERAIVKGHASWGSALAASADGAVLCSGRYGGILMYDTSTMEERFTIATHDTRIDSCAVTPDGRFIISASLNATVKVWDRDTGAEVAALSLPGHFMCMALHPYLPQLVGGDAGGAVYIIDLVGLTYGRLLVTPVTDGSNRLWVRCPQCGGLAEIEGTNLGTVMPCPRARCESRLRINAFVTGTNSNGLPREPEWAVPRSPVHDDDPAPDDMSAATTPGDRGTLAQLVFGHRRSDRSELPSQADRLAEITAFRTLLRGSLSADLWQVLAVTCQWGRWPKGRSDASSTYGAHAVLVVDGEDWQLGAIDMATSPTGLGWLLIPPGGRTAYYEGRLEWMEDLHDRREPTLEMFILQQVALYRSVRFSSADEGLNNDT